MLAIFSLSAAGRQSTDVTPGNLRPLGLLGLNPFHLLNQECSYLEVVDSYTVNTTALHYCSTPAADESGTALAPNGLLKNSDAVQSERQCMNSSCLGPTHRQRTGWRHSPHR